MASKSKAKVKAKATAKPKAVRGHGRSAKKPADIVVGNEFDSFTRSIHSKFHPKKSAKPKRAITVAGQPTRFIREIKIGERHRKDMGDLAGLARSIDDRGALLQPVVIDKDNNLIAGQRRMAAWPLSKFRREPIPVTVVDIDAIVAGEWDENAKRKDFTPSECASIARALEPIAAAKAKERQRQHGGTTHGRQADATEGKGKAADLVAAYVGKDRKTIQRAQEVIDAADRDPEKFGPLKEQMDKTGKVNGAWRRLQVHNQVADIKTRKQNGTLAIPEGKFDRMVADMPWPYEPDDETPAERGRAVRGYATMSIKEMKALPIADRCADNCVLYFWVTNFHMEYAYQVMRAWGFAQFPTIITWTKDKFGKGQRLRCATEHCIIAIKGKPVWSLTNETTRLDGPVREDSRKPDEFYALIDAITPAERSLELFARRELPEGWVGFGDQVGMLKDDPPPAEVPQRELTELEILERIEAAGDLPPKGPGIDQIKEQKLARGSVKLKLTKAGMKRLEALRKEEYSKSDDAPPADRGDDDQVQENSIPQVDCRVCSEGTGLCAECIAAGDHIFQVWRDHQFEPAPLVAACSCGFECRVECAEDFEPSAIEQDKKNAAIKAHLRNVVTEAKAAASSAAIGDIPASIKRGPDGLAPYQREAAE